MFLWFKRYWPMFVFTPFIAFLDYLKSYHQAELVQDGKASEYGIYNLSYSLISLFLTVVLIKYFKLDWVGRLIAILIAETFVVLFMYVKTFDTIHSYKVKFKMETFKEFVFFGWPLMLGLGCGWALNQADRYIVLNYFSLKEVGTYSVAYSIGMIINIINQATTNAIVPKIYRALEEKKGHKLVSKLYLYSSTILILISLIIGGGAYLYVPIIFGRLYAESANIVFLIALAFGFNGIYRVGALVLQFYKKNTLQFILVGLGAGINILISIILVPYLGLLSPAIGSVAAYIFLAYFSFYFGCTILRKEEVKA